MTPIRRLALAPALAALFLTGCGDDCCGSRPGLFSRAGSLFGSGMSGHRGCCGGGGSAPVSASGGAGGTCCGLSGGGEVYGTPMVMNGTPFPMSGPIPPGTAVPGGGTVVPPGVPRPGIDDGRQREDNPNAMPKMLPGTPPGATGQTKVTGR